MSELGKRVLTGLIGAALLLTALFASEYSLMAVLALLALAISAEYGSLLARRFDTPSLRFVAPLAIACLLGLVAWRYTAVYIPLRLAVLVCMAGLAPILMIFSLFAVQKDSFQAAAMLYLGVPWIGLPFILGWQIATDTVFEPWRLVGLFFLIWSADVGAYFAGRAFGKHPLFARISPKKTWEGFFGGLLLALAMACALSYFTAAYVIIDWLALALLCSTFGALGDLVESAFKRSLDLKDSGGMLPGHGGFLDRFDAFLISVPAAWIYLIIQA